MGFIAKFIATVASLGSAVSSVMSMTQSKPKPPPAPPPPAETPGTGESQQAAQEQAQARNRRRSVARARNETIYTSPLGVSGMGGQANIARKKLLGV